MGATVAEEMCASILLTQGDAVGRQPFGIEMRPKRPLEIVRSDKQQAKKPQYSWEIVFLLK
jgi:hypothetical protein